MNTTQNISNQVGWNGDGDNNDNTKALLRAYSGNEMTVMELVLTLAVNIS